MTGFRGFETKKDAKAFIKLNGRGSLSYESDENGKGYHQDEYRLAVNAGGLDSEKYPYCVMWNEA